MCIEHIKSVVNHVTNQRTNQKQLPVVKQLPDKCEFYILHPDTKKPHTVTFSVASNEGSVLLSCTILLALDLIQTRPCLDYLPSKAKLITSAPDHPNLTEHTVHQAKATVKPKEPQSKPMKIVTNKATIKEHYQDVFEGVECFPGK